MVLWDHNLCGLHDLFLVLFAMIIVKIYDLYGVHLGILKKLKFT